MILYLSLILLFTFNIYIALNRIKFLKIMKKRSCEIRYMENHRILRTYLDSIFFNQKTGFKQHDS